MTSAVRYVAHATVGTGTVVAGFVGIDPRGRPVLRGGIDRAALVEHGWRADSGDEDRAHALAGAAEAALADLGYRRGSPDALDWAVRADPDGPVR
ncbi:MAG TPA: hypothetical protein PKB06_10085 [Actinotalea sp.]|nr:hypothetical protein [Actinotalea sp.]